MCERSLHRCVGQSNRRNKPMLEKHDREADRLLKNYIFLYQTNNCSSPIQSGRGSMRSYPRFGTSVVVNGYRKGVFYPAEVPEPVASSASSPTMQATPAIYPSPLPLGAVSWMPSHLA